MTVYLLINGRNQSIVRACDLERNAITLKTNLLKTGEYDILTIEPVDVDTEDIADLAVVSIAGHMTNSGPQVTIKAYNADSVIDDTLIFKVNGSDVRFSGFVNLTPDEAAVKDITNLTKRIKLWISTEYKSRLEDNNQLI